MIGHNANATGKSVSAAGSKLGIGHGNSLSHLCLKIRYAGFEYRNSLFLSVFKSL